MDSDDRNVAINIAAAFLIKGASFVITFVALPMYIRYFDDSSALGVWYTVLAILTWVNAFDLGLGNGLRNMLTEALACEDFDRAKRYISTTYFVMSLLGVAMIVAFLAVANCVDLNSVLNISEDVIPAESLGMAVTVLTFGVCVSFVLRVINAVLYAMQHSSINNLLALLSSILPLAYVALAPAGGDNGASFVALSVVYSLSTNAILIVATVVVFARGEMAACAPSVGAITKNLAGDLLGFGLRFFVAQVFFLVLMSTNEALISALYDPGIVVDYSAYNRLYTAVGAVFMLALTPLWSKITKDYALGKYSKIIKTNHLLYLLAAVAAICEFCIVPLTGIILKIWLGEGVVAFDAGTAIIFAVFGSLYVFNVSLTTVANGIGELKTQIVVYGITACVKVPVCIAMSSILSWQSVVGYTGASLFVFCVVQVIWLERRLALLGREGGVAGELQA